MLEKTDICGVKKSCVGDPEARRAMSGESRRKEIKGEKKWVL